MLPIFLAIENQEERLLAEELYNTYKNRMYNIAFSILHNREDAEDAVMDAVCKIVRNISLFNGIERNKAESLIVIIIRNTAINRYHYNRHRIHSDIDEIGEYIPDNSFQPADILIASEDYDQLLKQIRSLEPIYRDVLLLKYLYNYNNSKISSLTGVAEATVRVRLMRARKMLMDILNGGVKDEK